MEGHKAYKYSLFGKIFQISLSLVICGVGILVLLLVAKWFRSFKFVSIAGIIYLVYYVIVDIIFYLFVKFYATDKKFVFVAPLMRIDILWEDIEKIVKKYNSNEFVQLEIFKHKLKSPVIICSRIKDYEEIVNKVLDNVNKEKIFIRVMNSYGGWSKEQRE